MPKLAEIISMFERFGFTEAEVRKALASGDSAHNAFESLKVMLDLRWSDLNMEASPETLAELKPLYHRIQGITMTARKTKAAADAERLRKTKAALGDILLEHDRRKEENVETFMKTVGKALQKKKERGELTKEAEERIRKMGFGAYVDDD